MKRSWTNENLEAYMVTVYVPNADSNQLILWDDLKSQTSSYWITVGDFNTVISRSERSGRSRLDRFLVNEECCLKLKDLTQWGLNQITSRFFYPPGSLVSPSQITLLD
ncbi:hypothetical protein V6N11_035351 [Hibiscus sabdariffa]|uniref:Endonuclease/exonuclease/phosphatase domain-containing protein n=1 Tax=Hibiscus sabdariffa TaxID=183260 RepID=A0ABR2R0K1_9ROSI